MAGEITRQFKAAVKPTSLYHVASMIMGCITILAAIGVGTYMVMHEHNPGHRDPWYFVGGLLVFGCLALVPGPLIQLVQLVPLFKKKDAGT